MRRNITAIVLSLFLITVASAQDKTWQDISLLLRNGSSKELMKFCGAQLTLKMDGSNATFSRADAESKLRKFFLDNPPTNFSFVHQGSSAEGLKYSIGKYSIRGGSYRVVMFLKEKSGSYLLESISLTKE